jgi:hypothetical protein
VRRYSLLAAAGAVLVAGCWAPVAAAGVAGPGISAAGPSVTERSAGVAVADGSGERRVIVLGRTSPHAAAFGITPSAAGTVEHNIWPLPLPEAIGGR